MYFDFFAYFFANSSYNTFCETELSTGWACGAAAAEAAAVTTVWPEKNVIRLPAEGRNDAKEYQLGRSGLAYLTVLHALFNGEFTVDADAC